MRTSLLLAVLAALCRVGACEATGAVKDLLAEITASASALVPGWVACLAAVQARYPTQHMAVWCESAGACLPDEAFTTSDQSVATTWMQATAARATQFSTPRYSSMLHVFVHVDKPPCPNCRLWRQRRERRVHVWLGQPNDGLDYLRGLWHVAGLSDVLLLMPAGDGDDKGVVLVYSVYPYGLTDEREGPCNSDAPVLVDEWVPDTVPDDGGGGHRGGRRGGHRGGAFRHGRHLFPRDKLRDLRGCNLTVFVSEDHPFMEVKTNRHTGQMVLEGHLKDVFRVMRQRLNFRAVLRTSKNDTATCESHLATQLRHAHLAFTMAVRSSGHGPVWYDFSPFVVCLAWCVPIKSVSAFSIQDYLSSGTWSVIGLSFVATGVAMALLHRPGMDSIGGLWGAWALLCGPLLQQPVVFNRPGGGTQVRTLALRAVVAHWGLAALVLVAVLESSVKSASIASRSQPLVRSVSELARSSLELQGSVAVVDLLRHSSEEVLHDTSTNNDEVALYQHLASRLRVCDTHLNDALHRVAKHLDTAVLTTDIRCKDYNRRHPEPGLFVFRDYCLRPSTLHLFTAPKWSPYLPRVSEVGLRLQEAGLVQRALESSHAAAGPAEAGLSRRGCRSSRSTTVQVAALGLEAVTLPLCILCVGLALALAVLTLEVVWAKSSHSLGHSPQSSLARKYSVHEDKTHDCQALVTDYLSEQKTRGSVT